MSRTRPQRVRVPWRVVASSHYSDAALAVYVKVAALGARPEGCTASVEYLVGLLGMSRSGVERALTQLMRPAPDDDVAELTSYRRTHPGGMGTTAVRRVRKPSATEAFVWVPSAAAESLSPRQLRAYAAVAYAVATGHQVTLAELGQVLRSRSGKRAGQPLDPRTVRRTLRSLADLGWIAMDARAGYRGRHTYTVYEEPAQLSLTADTHDGSGADLGDGSLATKEAPRTDSPDDERAGGSIRRRRDQVVARGPVENPAPAPLRAAPKRPYTGPGLTLAPRIWQVLEPVHVLFGGLSPYVVRKLAREVGHQLDRGVEPERLRSRLEFRFACTDEIRDPGRWLLGAAVIRRGCGLDACESGVIWRTGERCQVCAARPPGRPPGPRRPGNPAPAYPGPPRQRATCCPCPDCSPAPSRSPR
ncbi:hypothetical protein [Streptomyces vilmorinianum]|uniref:hypothetical protein n=1 Tax=Streptomyces vilmorinianum TaxID=3051092 RepID=UPI0010FAD76C|nr:hypothetical protein [Streptomyces vilmorinianum]